MQQVNTPPQDTRTKLWMYMLLLGFFVGLYVQKSCDHCDSSFFKTKDISDIQYYENSEQETIEELKKIKQDVDSIKRPSQDEIKNRIEYKQKMLRDSDSFTI
jgi:hypothetical protein